MLTILIMLCSSNPQGKPIRDAIGPSNHHASRNGSIDRLGEYINVIDKLLLFEAWLKQKSIPSYHVDYVEEILPKFLMQIKNTLARASGHGMKIRKFHYTLHIPQSIRDLGSPLNFTGQGPESNMKQNVKQNARRTQKRQNTIDYQTGVRFVETRILSITNSFGSHLLGHGYTNIIEPKALPTHRKGVGWTAVMSNEDTNPEMQFTKNRPLTRECWKSLYLSFDDFRSFVQKKIHPHLTPDCRGQSLVEFFTEFVANDKKFHANPLWKSTAWHDWAYIANPEKRHIPCHLMCFLDITENMPNMKECLTGDVVPGTYALVQYVPEDPLCDLYEGNHNQRTQTIYTNTDGNYFLSENCLSLRWSCKVTRNIGNGQEPPFKPDKPLLQLVNVESISDVCIAVPDPNQPQFPHGWIFVASRSSWALLFMEYARQLKKENIQEDRTKLETDRKQKTLDQDIDSSDSDEAESEEEEDIENDQQEQEEVELDEEDNESDDNDSPDVSQQSRMYRKRKHSWCP